MLNILYTLGARPVGFKSLADSWADTTTPHGRLLVTMLAGIAEFERELIRARTERQEVVQRLVGGAVQADLARTYGVSQATFGAASVGAA